MKIDHIISEIKEHLYEEFEKIKHFILEEEYTKYCGDENIDLSLRDKRRNLLIK
jgi:hypothetical protein